MKFYTYIYYDPTKSSDLTDNGLEPFYVGKGQGERLVDHMKESNLNKDRNTHKGNKIKKLITNGTPPVIEIYEYFDNEEDAFTSEIALIRRFGRADKKLGPLTNRTDGGEGGVGRIVTNEVREKLRVAATGYKHTDAAKAKMSKNRTGMKMKPETIQKSATSRTGLKMSSEARLAMSRAQQALHNDPLRHEIWVTKQREAQLGILRSSETKLKLRNGSKRSQPILFEGVEYPSLRAAEEATGTPRKKISRECTKLAVKDQEVFNRLNTQKPISELSPEEKARRISANKSYKPIEYEGVVYMSLRDAERSTGVSRHRIKNSSSYKLL